jgi:hypothetical protein
VAQFFFDYVFTIARPVTIETGIWLRAEHQRRVPAIGFRRRLPVGGRTVSLFRSNLKLEKNTYVMRNSLIRNYIFAGSAILARASPLSPGRRYGSLCGTVKDSWDWRSPE